MTGMIRNTSFFAIFLQSAVKAVCCHNLTVRFKNIYSISYKLFIGKLFHRLIQPRRRPAGHDADGGSVLILLGAVTILIKLL